MNSAAPTRKSSPFALPAAMLEDAKKLTWLDVVSPDFDRPSADKPVAGKPPPRPMRAQIGLDPKTHLPQLALVALPGALQP